MLEFLGGVCFTFVLEFLALILIAIDDGGNKK